MEIRKEICNIISGMLDNPDEDDIYPTTKCYDKFEKLYENQNNAIKKAKEWITKLTEHKPAIRMLAFEDIKIELKK